MAVQRGRKSQEKAKIEQMELVSRETRLPAPSDLTEYEQSIFNVVIADHPAGSFTPTHVALLKMYCQHVAQAQKLAMALNHFGLEQLLDKDEVKRYEKLLNMHETETRAASSLGTRLRITRQATYDPKTVARANRNMPKGEVPWQE